MPTVEENREYWSRYEWKPAAGAGGGEEWTTGYGGPDNAWYGVVLPRIAAFLPAQHALELGPGHGLWTARLRPRCQRMTLVDLTPACISACRAKFGAAGMRYIVNDGRSLPGVEDGSVDLVFSWHSLVHCERDVMGAYVRELARVMRPGAVGLIHHSNFGEFVDPATGSATLENVHWRGKTMTARAFREDCAAAGLACNYQELVPWGSDHLIDCFSMFTRPASGAPVETVIEENYGFWHRVQDLIRVSSRYAHPFPELKARPRRTILGMPIGAPLG